MSNDLQPDFVAKVGNSDVTKHLTKWKLQDLEDNLSSIVMTIENVDYQYSGKFRDEDEISIKWGYQGNLGGKATFELKACEENYGTDGCYVIVTGLDPAHRMTGAAARGSFFNSKSYKKMADEIAQWNRLSIKWGGTPQEPNLPADYNYPVPAMRHDVLVRQMMMHMIPPGKGGKVGGIGKSNQPIKSQPNPKGGGSFKGKQGRGWYQSRAGGMMYTKTDTDKENTTIIAKLKEISNAAASESIYGKIELKGIPQLRAKKGITILNVGPDYSGKWYVKGVDHEWDVKKGYYTVADLLRDQLGAQGIDTSGDVFRPMVMHGDPYDKDTIICEPRDMNAASQITVTFGKGENVVQFKGAWQVQGSRGAGEGGDIKFTAIDAVPHEAQHDATPDASSIGEALR